jgi:hypothetical protein
VGVLAVVTTVVSEWVPQYTVEALPVTLLLVGATKFAPLTTSEKLGLPAAIEMPLAVAKDVIVGAATDTITGAEMAPVEFFTVTLTVPVLLNRLVGTVAVIVVVVPAAV